MQVTERSHTVVEVANCIGMSDKSLYLWVRLAKKQQGVTLFDFAVNPPALWEEQRSRVW